MSRRQYEEIWALEVDIESGVETVVTEDGAREDEDNFDVAQELELETPESPVEEPVAVKKTKRSKKPKNDVSVDEVVLQDPEEPGADVRAGLVGVEEAVGPQQRLLDQVLRVLLVPGHSQGQIEE